MSYRGGRGRSGSGANGPARGMGRGAYGGPSGGMRGAGMRGGNRPRGPMASASMYQDYQDYDDYGYGAKRPIDEMDPMAVKRQRTSSMQMMNMMIQDSQRELANLTFENSSKPRRGRGGASNLNQVLSRQQMLLEMQSEMLAGMGSRRGGKSSIDDTYYPSTNPRSYQQPPPAHRNPRGRGRGGSVSRDYFDYPQEREMPMYDHNPYLDYEYDDGMAGPAPEYYVSIEGKINNFIKILFNYDNFTSPVSAIETSRHDSTDLVKIRTEYNVFEDMDKDPYIDGHLKINGVFLAREQGYSRHSVKEKVYSKALYMLLTKSVSEIFDNSNKLAEALPENQKVVKNSAMKKEKSGKKERDHRFILARLKELVSALREDLPQSGGRGGKENMIHELDVACGNSDAAVTLVFWKNGEDSFTCELYADDLMLGSGEESDKRGAMKNAYRNAKRMIMNWHLTPDKIVRDNKRLQFVDFLHPRLIDVQYKAKMHDRITNLMNLKAAYPETFAEDIKTYRDVVAYELEDHGYQYKSLEDTASYNRMLLESIVHSAEGTATRCLIFLQGDLIADARGYNKIKAKSNATAKAIQYFKKNCTLIQTSPRDYNNVAMNFEKAKEEAQKLMNDTKEEKVFDASSYQGVGPNDPQPDELSPWIDAVLENLLAEYEETNDLSELILDKDIPRYHQLKLRETAKNYNVHVIVRKNDDPSKSYCVIIQKAIFRNSDSQKVVEVLKACGNSSGRYKLVQYKDNSGEIIKV